MGFSYGYNQNSGLQSALNGALAQQRGYILGNTQFTGYSQQNILSALGQTGLAQNTGSSPLVTNDSIAGIPKSLLGLTAAGSNSYGASALGYSAPGSAASSYNPNTDTLVRDALALSGGDSNGVLGSLLTKYNSAVQTQYVQQQQAAQQAYFAQYFQAQAAAQQQAKMAQFRSALAQLASRYS